jgi:nucleotide-binding universal stress UspA family protein
MAMNGSEVLVAVGPDGVHEGALDLAAAEAERRGTGVLLLHVVHGLGETQDLDHALTAVGHRVLTDAADRLEGRIPFTTEIATGPVAATLAERAASAGLVVLERREVGSVERLLTMSVSTRVAAHAQAPVAVVPAGWTAPPGGRPVTVGVDDPRLADGQLLAALDLARGTKRRLVVLHAAWVPEAYQAMVAGDDRGRWVRQGTEALTATLARIGATDEVEVDVRWHRPVDALVLAAQRSSVLVLGRRPGRLGVHLGGLTRTVLRHAEAPVLVVDRS